MTSRHRGKWILPKGKIEVDETARERAAAEAFEEGGVGGTVAARPLIADRLADLSQPVVFAIEVLEEFSEWPEMRVSQRACVPLSEARSMITEGSLRKVLEAFASERRAQRTPVLITAKCGTL
ncbi:NUDIX domain-containing protein [Novosphingobium sp. P6W]|uniref:NUDIX domain-containing protein n=1 Tax=Novosphingobium sp. P6W TaxID=1609758 RepID=UPI0013B35CBC|nr:NUDIX domain-containing protein [Novosphingobium sp. P6W]